MASTRAAQRYAKALLELAQEKNCLKEVSTDISLIKQTLYSSKDLKLALKNPVIKPSQKKEVLQQVFSNTHQITKELFNVLIANSRIDSLDLVADQFQKLANKLNNITEAQVITAETLSPEMREKVMQKLAKLTKSEIKLSEKINKDILGGFILRIGDIQYDASIAGKLNALKQQFNNSNTVVSN